MGHLLNIMIPNFMTPVTSLSLSKTFMAASKQLGTGFTISSRAYCGKASSNPRLVLVYISGMTVS
jgi:hypothetical protein